MEITKQDFKAALELIKQRLEPHSKCEHLNATEATEDGLVYVDCPDCNMHYIVNEQQAEAYRRMDPERIPTT
jgi:hypothetical protein